MEDDRTADSGVGEPGNMDNDSVNNENVDTGTMNNREQSGSYRGEPEPINGAPGRLSDDEDELHFGQNENEARFYGNESPRYLDNLARGRASKFYINGDKFFPARKVVYNPKHFKVSRILWCV